MGCVIVINAVSLLDHVFVYCLQVALLLGNVQISDDTFLGAPLFWVFLGTFEIIIIRFIKKKSINIPLLFVCVVIFLKISSNQGFKKKHTHKKNFRPADYNFSKRVTGNNFCCCGPMPNQ